MSFLRSGATWRRRTISPDTRRRNDLNAFATKEDLKAFATKEDLKAFATKEDLKAFATKDDFIGLKNEMHVLYEDLVERLKLLGESWSRSKRTSRKKP